MPATLECPTSVAAASTADHGPSGGDRQELQLVTFEAGAEEFAVNILQVQEINRMLAITRVPQSPPAVEGVINLRGRIIPVLDLRQRFRLEAQAHGTETRIIVVEVAGRVLGFTVDRVHEVLRIDRAIVDPAPAMVKNHDSDYIAGVGKLEDRLIILLDLARLFGDQTLAQMDQIAAAA
jgi:purine-binding chemotaxis protein CheW